MKRNFILLLALSKDSRAYSEALMARIKRDVDATARACWIDSRGAGVFIQSDLPGVKIWDAAIPRDESDAVRVAFRDMLILEIGEEGAYRPESIAHAWLSSHRLPRREGSS